MSKPRIVVVGGGAGGLPLVTRLGRKLGKYGHADVTLVDSSSIHVWKPRFHEVATGAIDADLDAVDYRAHAQLNHYRFEPGTLTQVDDTGDQVLRMQAESKFAVEIPSAVPDRFTVEFDAYVPFYTPLCVTTTAFAEERTTNCGTGMEWDGATGVIIGGGYFEEPGFFAPSDSRSGTATFEHYEPINEGYVPVRISADGAYVKVYFGQTRVVNIPNAELARGSEIVFSAEDGYGDDDKVFIDDLRVPDSARLGGESEGWKVALTTLMNERFSISVGRASGGARAEELIALATRVERNGRPAIEDGEVRSRIADFVARQRGLEFTSYRVMTSLSRGEAPGEESSIGKLLLGKLRQEMGAFGMELAGTAAGISVKAGDDAARWRNEYLTAPGNRIAGGSDEIQRTIIGERILGLPPDIRLDKSAPFSEL